MQDIGHVRIGKHGKPLIILQATDLHHFPASAKAFDVRVAKGRVVALRDGQLDSDVRLLAKLIARIEPDVVILTGDIIDGRPFGHAGLNVNAWRAALRAVLAPVIAAGCHWSFVPGNHDDDGSPWPRSALLGAYTLGGEEQRLCLSSAARSFDHTLTVGPTAKADARTSVRLWLFDSGANDPDPNIKYTTFSAAAVSGVRSLAASHSLAPSAMSLCYFHIPLPQSGGVTPAHGTAGLFDAALNSGAVPKPFCWMPWLLRLLGKHHVVGSSKLESGLFDALLEYNANGGRVRACFYGHDHYNDSIVERDGIFLCYGRVGGFTPPCKWEDDGGPLPFGEGARVVRYAPADGSLLTWCEEEGGPDPESHFVLHAGSQPHHQQHLEQQKLPYDTVMGLAGQAGLIALVVIYLQAAFNGDLFLNPDWTISNVMVYEYNRLPTKCVLFPVFLCLCVSYSLKLDTLSVRMGSAVATIGGIGLMAYPVTTHESEHLFFAFVTFVSSWFWYPGCNPRQFRTFCVSSAFFVGGFVLNVAARLCAISSAGGILAYLPSVCCMAGEWGIFITWGRMVQNPPLSAIQHGA